MEKRPEGISPVFGESSYSSFRECYPWLTDEEAKARKISNLTSATQEQEPTGSLNSGAWVQRQGFSPTWLPGTLSLFFCPLQGPQMLSYYETGLLLHFPVPFIITVGFFP